jgi:DNA-binding YbaB/EbfC family protein
VTVAVGDFRNLGQLFRQAEQVQAKLHEIQEEMGKKKVEGSAGGGMVTVVMNGKMQMVSVKLDHGLLAEGERDVDLLQDLITAAVNDAIHRAQALMAEEVAKVTGGVGVPGAVRP